MLKKVCAERGTLTNGWVSLAPADLGLIESVYKRNLREGEERLMLAVLESAVEDFQKYLRSRSACGKRLFREAEQWFLDENNEALFSFRTVCETLGLHPGPIRKGLMGWKKARLTIISSDQHAGHGKPSRNRVKHIPVRLSKMA